MSFNSVPIYNLYWNDRSMYGKNLQGCRTFCVPKVAFALVFIVTSNCEPEGRQATTPTTPTGTPTPAERRNWP